MTSKILRCCALGRGTVLKIDFNDHRLESQQCSLLDVETVIPNKTVMKTSMVSLTPTCFVDVIVNIAQIIPKGDVLAYEH